MTTVKRTDPVPEGHLLFVAVDQSFHLIALFLVALLAAS